MTRILQRYWTTVERTTGRVKKLANLANVREYLRSDQMTCSQMHHCG
ncbi:hypothetical protein BH10PLA2_BH10PLA2_26070 [soil metagenome]